MIHLYDNYIILYILFYFSIKYTKNNFTNDKLLYENPTEIDRAIIYSKGV